MEEQLKGIEVSEKTPDDYFRMVLNLAKDQGWDLEKTDKYAELLMKHAPRYAPAHTAIADYLMPRWHGKPGDSEAYARKVADRIGGPDGAAVYAQVAMDLARYYTPNVSSRDFMIQDLGFDLDRVWEGLTHLHKQSPDASSVVREADLYRVASRRPRGRQAEYRSPERTHPVQRADPTDGRQADQPP